MSHARLSRRAFLGGSAAALAVPALLSTPARADDKPLRIRVAESFQSFDPAFARGADAVIARNIFAPLVRYKPRTALSGPSWEWINELLDRWDFAKDKLEYTFTLRSEVWRDNSPVTAQDAAFSFQRILGTTTPALTADNEWRLDNVASVEAPDAATLKLRLKRRDDRFMLNVLPQIAGCIVPQTYLSGLGDGRVPLQPEISSGRYRVAEIDPSSFARLDAADTWQGSKATVQTAVFIVIQDEGAARQMFAQHQIDVLLAGRDTLQENLAALAGAPAEIVSAAYGAGGGNAFRSRRMLLSQAGGLGDDARVVRASTSSIAYVAINSNSPVLESLDVRQALQRGIDVRRAQQAGYGSADLPVPPGVVAPGWAGAPETRRVDQAANALGELSGKLQGSLRIIAMRDPAMARMAADIAAQLKAAGIEADLLEPTAWYEAVDLLKRGDVELAVLSTYPAYVPGGGLGEDFDYAKQRNAELAKLGEETLDNDDNAIEARAEFQKILVDAEALALPLAEDHQVYVIRQGITPSFDPDGNIGDLGDWQFG